MRVSKAIKKIVALGVGATMMGATILGATAAADLKDYPTFFLDGGTFDGVIVVRGEVDSLAAVDIAANMNYASGTAASTATTVSGDAWLVGTSSKKLELGNNNATGASITSETFRDINTFIGDEELKALGDGTWSTNEQDYTYQQFLFFDNDHGAPATGGNRASRVVKYVENDEDVTSDFLFIANGKQIARYKTEFTSAASSDVTDSTGTADSTGTYLDDFDNTDLSLWGTTFNMVQARRIDSTTTGGNNAKLVLMAGPVRDTLLEGESKTYQLDGEDYEVELSFVDADEALFLVNGERTNKLQEGETYTLSNKKEVGVSEILYQDYAGGVHSTTFYLGAQKLEFRDNNIGDSQTSSHDLKIASEDIDGAAVYVTGTNTNTTYTINTLEVNMTAEDDYFVGAGEKLSDVIAASGDEKELLFGNKFEVEYKGLTTETTHDLKLKTSSSRRYKLQLYDGDGNAVDIPVAYAENITHVSVSEDGVAGVARENQKRTHFEELTNALAVLAQQEAFIYKDDYLVVTGGTAADGSAKSYLLQYKGQDRTTKTSPKMKFKNMGTGEVLEYSTASTNASATIKIGGYSFDVFGQSTTADDQPILVDLDGGGALGAANVSFVDNYGSQWAVNTNQDGNTHSSWTNMTATIINQTTPDADDYDNWVPVGLALTITSTAGPELRAALIAQSQATAGALNLVTPDGETEVSYGYTSMGSFITFNEPSGDPDELTLTYPAKQRLPQVYITAGETTSTTSTTGGTATRVTIPVTATKLPEEVANVAAQHVITVGGPCANSVTAAVMYAEQGKEVPANCAEGFNEGEARVALYDVGSNVAMVVAGYSGDDTRRAGKVIASRVKELSGSEVVVQGTTVNNAEIVKVS